MLMQQVVVVCPPLCIHFLAPSLTCSTVLHQLSFGDPSRASQFVLLAEVALWEFGCVKVVAFCTKVSRMQTRMRASKAHGVRRQRSSKTNLWLMW
eukprot:5477311-Amphidinium_carterae.2